MRGSSAQAQHTQVGPDTPVGPPEDSWQVKTPVHRTSDGTNHVSRWTRSIVLRAVTLGTLLCSFDLSEELSIPEF